MPLCRKTSAVALGSNLGDCLSTLCSAAQALQYLGSPDCFICSPLFRTAPVGGPEGQPDFINAVVFLDWERSPEDLLRELQKLELAAGRKRLIQDGPRSLDLDLLWCGSEHIDTHFLKLPHPRLSQRRFVLEPLASLAPELIPPGQNLSVKNLLNLVISQGCETTPELLQSPPLWPAKTTLKTSV